MVINDVAPDVELETIFAASSVDYGRLLCRRNGVLQRLLTAMITQQKSELLGVAPTVQSVLKPSGKPHIARMRFVKQYALTYDLMKKKLDRFRSQGILIRVRCDEVDVANNCQMALCTVLEGIEAIEPSKDFFMGSWLMRPYEHRTMDFHDERLLDSPAYALVKAANGATFCDFVEWVGYPGDLERQIRIRCFGEPVEEWEDYAIQERRVDFVTKSVLKALDEVDISPTQTLFDELMTFSFSRNVPAPAPEFMNHEQRLCLGGFVLTESQTAAYIHMLNQRLTIVWGPPGSGKSRSLSVSIVALALQLEVFGRRQDKVVVLVTASTNPALDHLKTYIDAVVSNHFGRTSNERCLVQIVKSKTKNPKLRPISILLGTVWGLRKYSGILEDQASAIFVDEASQMVPADFCVACSLLDQKKGRLILAGWVKGVLFFTTHFSH